VVGKAEAEDAAVETVSVRHRVAGDLGSGTPLHAWIEKMTQLVATRATSEDEQPAKPGGAS
jgi:hypothetical protein